MGQTWHTSQAQTQTFAEKYHTGGSISRIGISLLAVTKVNSRNQDWRIQVRVNGYNLNMGPLLSKFVL